MKRILSIALMLILFQNIFSYAAEVQVQNPESDGTFLFVREGDLVVIKGLVKGDDRYSFVGNETGVHREFNASTLYVPATIGGTHIELGAEAFRGKNGFKKIVFEQGITHIPEGLCRDMPNLEEVVIPGSVVEIGDYAFRDCKKLKTIGLLYATKIGKESFAWCESLENISFVEGVKVEKSAFEGADVMLPSEAFGCTVEWNYETKTVKITN